MNTVDMHVCCYSVGFMNFGMNGSFAKLVGILMCANAIFEMLIISCHPEFKNGHLTSTMDPTASYTGASEVTRCVFLWCSGSSF